jgi:hypothetical protein
MFFYFCFLLARLTREKGDTDGFITSASSCWGGGGVKDLKLSQNNNQRQEQQQKTYNHT